MSYDELIVDQIYNAYELLDAATATLGRTILGPIDPGTGEPTSSVTQSFPTRCKLDATSLRTLGFKFNESLIKGGEMQASVPAKGLEFEPEAGNSILIGGVTYSVVDVRPSFAPGGAAVEYALMVRK